MANTSLLQIAGATTRRAFFSSLGQATLSATAMGLIVGCSSMAKQQGGDTAAGDVSILNVALGLEHEAIGAYQLGAESGLLQKPVLDVAVLFQSHHKSHRDALIGAIEQMGGTPVQAESLGHYADALNAGALSSQTDVLALAADLEGGAANAYLGVLPSFGDPALGQVAARLAADETMHWTALTQALGRPLPKQALTFGA